MLHPFVVVFDEEEDDNEDDDGASFRVLTPALAA